MPKDPKILWNAKDHPEIGSGYGIMGKHLLPRLADKYGKKNILIFAPVFNNQRIEYWNGMKVLPGPRQDFSDDIACRYYADYDCTMLLQVGDFLGLKALPEAAAKDEVVWVQWAPWDYWYLPPPSKALMRYPVMIVPFTAYGEQKFRDLGLENVHEKVWIGLDLDIWKPIPRAELAKTMKKLRFEEDAWNILIVQANQQRKYLQETIHGIGAFAEHNPDVKLRIFLHTNVDGREANLAVDISYMGLIDTTQVMDQFLIITGGVSEEDMVEMFNCADVVMDVCYEGFGLSMTQAQAVGVPVIGLLEGPMQELVSYGIACPPTHVDHTIDFGRPVAGADSIATGLQSLYTDGARKVDHRILSEDFNWDKIAEEWFDVIKEVHEMREKFTLYIPEPSEELKKKARTYIEVAAS